MATQAILHKMSQLKLRIASYRYSLLLCSQFALIVIAPLAHSEEFRPSPLFTVFALTLLLTALNLVIHKRRLRTLAFVLFAAAMLTSLLSAVGFEHVFLIPGITCLMVFMVFMIAVILSDLIAATTVTRDILYGAVSAYMFIGIAWGMAYSLVELLAPGSIIKTIDTKHPLVWTDFTFFSFHHADYRGLRQHGAGRRGKGTSGAGSGDRCDVSADNDREIADAAAGKESER